MNQESLEALATRLDEIGEEIADLAIESIRDALQSAPGGRPPAERELTQARRAVVKAAHALRSLNSGRGEQAGAGDSED